MKCQIVIPDHKTLVICPNEAKYIMDKSGDRAAVCEGHRKDLEYAYGGNLPGGKVIPTFEDI